MVNGTQETYAAKTTFLTRLICPLEKKQCYNNQSRAPPMNLALEGAPTPQHDHYAGKNQRRNCFSERTTTINVIRQTNALTLCYISSKNVDKVEKYRLVLAHIPHPHLRLFMKHHYQLIMNPDGFALF